MVKSARGREVDMDALRNVNEESVAVGNARMNARGDVLGKNGKILKTREQIAKEYHKVNTPNTAKNVPLSKDLEDMLSPRPKKETKENQKPQKKKSQDNSSFDEEKPSTE